MELGSPDIAAKTKVFRNSNGAVTSAKQRFNSDWRWNDASDGGCAINPSNHVADIRPITAHESGHWIVLGENGGNTQAERDALMYSDAR